MQKIHFIVVAILILLSLSPVFAQTPGKKNEYFENLYKSVKQNTEKRSYADKSMDAVLNLPNDNVFKITPEIKNSKKARAYILSKLLKRDITLTDIEIINENGEVGYTDTVKNEKVRLVLDENHLLLGCKLRYKSAFSKTKIPHC